MNSSHLLQIWELINNLFVKNSNIPPYDLHGQSHTLNSVHGFVNILEPLVIIFSDQVIHADLEEVFEVCKRILGNV